MSARARARACVCVCVWYGMVSITFRFINSEELLSNSADEAVLPQLNPSMWVKSSSITVAILCTKSERFLPDSLFSYARQLSSPWGQNNVILFPSSQDVQLCTLKVPHISDIWMCSVPFSVYCIIVSHWTVSENGRIFYVIPHRQDHIEFQVSIHLICMYLITYNSGE